MGISGLLPFVKSACRQGNIRELQSKSVAVDVSCLLHRGLTGCMDKIHMGEDTQSYVHYVERYIKELIAMDCHVVMVFDGRPLPAKKQTNDDRRTQRDKNMQHAEILLAKGLEREAREKYRLATKISSDIVETTINYFRNWKNIDIVVAPYEADAQLAYLVKARLVDAVITEDSDLIVFGCEKIYFKWQSGSGDCSVYERENLKNCFAGELGGDKFDFVKFRRICILSGCDYLQAGLPGVGLSTAVKFFGKTSMTDIRSLLKKVPAYLNNSKLKTYITDEFIESFIKAENTFMFQVVFDPKERCQRPLNPYPHSQKNIEVVESELDDEGTKQDFSSQSSMCGFEYAGIVCPQKLSIRLALGNKADGAAINDKFLPLQSNPSWSVWSNNYESRETISIRVAKEKESTATVCGGAFKLDAPSIKKVKKSISSTSTSTSSPTLKTKRLFQMDDDDIVKQFMEDVEKEKVTKKRKNAPDDDYSAESIMAKYGNKKMKKYQPEQAEKFIEDDFDDVFEFKSKKDKQKIERKEVKHDECVAIPTVAKSEDCEGNAVISMKPASPELEVLRPPPLIRKIVSSPASATIPQQKKFQSPILVSHNSLPTTSKAVNRVDAETSSSVTPKETTSGKSKYFANKEKGLMSNPFRCPAFVKPPVSPPAKNELENQDSVLGGLDSEKNDRTTDGKNPESNNFRYVGFKVSGLRRKSTNK